MLNQKAIDENSPVLVASRALAERELSSQRPAPSAASRVFRLVAGLSYCFVGQAFGALCPEFYENPDNRECLNTINESLVAVSSSMNMLIFAVIMMAFVAGLLLGFKTASVRHQYSGDI